MESGSPGSDSARIRVGSWWFQPELKRLRDANSVVHLEPKVTLVLQRLIKNAGKAVTREELLNAAWQGVVVSDDALTQVIIKLRKALGDSPRDPRYVQTIPKRGYCLIAGTQADTDSNAPSAGQAQTRLAGKRRISKLVIPILAIAVIAAGLSYLLIEKSTKITTSAGKFEKATAEGTTLTVMPFAAITGNERERRFARGMRADLVTNLGSMSELAVISPSLNQLAACAIRSRLTCSRPANLSAFTCDWSRQRPVRT